MKRKAKETIRRGRQKRYGLLLLFFAVLLFLNLTGHPKISEAGVSTSQEIRVGLKNKFLYSHKFLLRTEKGRVEYVIVLERS